MEKEKEIFKEKIYLKKINWEAIIRPENLKKINDKTYNYTPITLDDVLNLKNEKN